MPVELNIVESVTELDTTVVTVVLESASEPGPAGAGVPTGGTDGQVLTKTSATDYATAWEDPTGGGGGGAPTDVDYLVGTASGDLSAEIVVGTAPGGELGGTWASPTVDTTHSGSSHASVQAAAEATAASALATHSADTTGVHGIADTSALALTASHPTNATFNDHSARHEDGGADELSIAGLAGIPTELQTHLDDTTAHTAANIPIVDAGNDFAATDVEGALAELQADHETDAQNLADHIADAAAAHAATAIAFTPDGSIAATTVQAAIVEVRDEATGVSASLFDANTILKADSDNTPAALTMGASTILARLAAGGIVAATPAEIRTLLDPASWFTFATYTPALTASVSDPTLGVSSSASGMQIAIGKLGIALVRITFGSSGTAAGSGTYRVGIPWTAHASQPALAGGSGLVYDSSANDTFPVVCGPVAGQDYAEMFLSSSTNASNVTHAVPLAWSTGDIIVLTIVAAIA